MTKLLSRGARHGLISLFAAWLLACQTIETAEGQSRPHTDHDEHASMEDILNESPADDWDLINPGETVYLELTSGQIVIVLATDFAPKSIARLKQLIRARFFDGLRIIRVEDNYVVQWGDSQAPLPKEVDAGQLQPEFTRPSRGLPFVALPDRDMYADEVGFSGLFPVGLNAADQNAWLLHCYGMVGVPRGNEITSGNVAELYAVIGHSPRYLDRNITLIGRVISGMHYLSSLPRGTGEKGFYQPGSQGMSIRRMRVAADLPETERLSLQMLRPNSPSFRAIAASLRSRNNGWFQVSPGRIDICSIPILIRERPAADGSLSKP